MGRDFRGADLSGGDFSNCWFTDAALVGVRLVGASLGTRFIGAELLDTDMKDSDLSDAVAEENYFEIKMDETTVLRGLTGTVFGPITVISDDSSHQVGGAELEAWISARGGQVQVIPPRRPAVGTP
ncbi:pentapeptide repeat-containing protein [Streptomyces sp. SID7909]|uniref:pentapeptide repeat-containing protein n=1 Tax=Streptomyces sp. SID7909 TaxID=2706092 RepID=UPI001EF3505B|nr:pentapeptide repeat-containing protein [Streptomyces sp. SID7909]